MNVPADALHALAEASGASVSLRAEGVVRWATGRLAEQDRALKAFTSEQQKQLRDAAEYALEYLTDPQLDDHNGAVEKLRAALNTKG